VGCGSQWTNRSGNRRGIPVGERFLLTGPGGGVLITPNSRRSGERAVEGVRSRQTGLRSSSGVRGAPGGAIAPGPWRGSGWARLPEPSAGGRPMVRAGKSWQIFRGAVEVGQTRIRFWPVFRPFGAESVLYIYARSTNSWPTAIRRGKINPGSNPWPQRAFIWEKSVNWPSASRTLPPPLPCPARPGQAASVPVEGSRPDRGGR
jgi:hypothetical protein